MDNCKEQAKQLQQQLDKAEEQNLAKSYFLAQASHDLLQPMEALRLFIYNLKTTNLDDMQKDIISKIEDTADNLETLLNNLLDFSKIESGGLRIQNSSFNLNELLQSIIDEVQEIAKSKDIEIKQYTRCDTNVVSDPILLERIIRNLLSNALKYTSNKILIGCRRSDDSIKISVADNGPGIGKFDLPHIFDDFFQSNHVLANRKQGAGLGLPIIRRITKLLGGKIKVKSILGKGSCFTIELPLKNN